MCTQKPSALAQWLNARPFNNGGAGFRLRRGPGFRLDEGCPHGRAKLQDLCVASFHFLEQRFQGRLFLQQAEGGFMRCRSGRVDNGEAVDKSYSPGRITNIAP